MKLAISLYSMFIMEMTLVFVGGALFVYKGFDGWIGVVIGICWGAAVLWPSYYVVRIIALKRELDRHDTLFADNNRDDLP